MKKDSQRKQKYLKAKDEMLKVKKKKKKHNTMTISVQSLAKKLKLNSTKESMIAGKFE